MAPTFVDRLIHGYNAFRDKQTIAENTPYQGFGGETSFRPDRSRIYSSNDMSIVNSIYVRMSVDVAAVDILHVRLDENNRYMETIFSGLNSCLTLEANIDQAARQFKQSIAWTLFTKGYLAIVPVDTSLNPRMTGSYDINTMRIGEILQFKPRSVRVAVYNDVTGLVEELDLPKDMVAIVENPFYDVMNQPNSMLKRLTRKLAILDSIDEASSSGKLDIIIQLPYVVKTDARRKEAEKRRNDIEVQLKNSERGIVYTDGTEKITQLNRPVENNLLGQIEFLTTMVYSQLGLTPGIFDGTASEAEMLNYHNRTVEPVLAAITEALERRFLTKTARSQLQAVRAFRDPFKYVPIGDIAELFDKITRNEIGTANEMRSIIGWKPHADPKADTLVNSNMPVDKRGGEQLGIEAGPADTSAEDAAIDSAFSGIESSIDAFVAGDDEPEP